jgi:hypothetical protein
MNPLILSFTYFAQERAVKRFSGLSLYDRKTTPITPMKRTHRAGTNRAEAATAN